MTRHIATTAILLAWAMGALAQTLVASAPERVSAGENFRLTYTVDTQSAGEFRIGSIPEALEVITGPYTSSQSSFQMVNGHTSSTSSITYTFILCASKAGTYTISPASVAVGGKRISSKALKVTVSGEAQPRNGAPRMHEDGDDGHGPRDAGTPISGSDLFIKVTASKQRVHEQEPILLTYKVYTLVDLVQLEGSMPDLTGFHTQEIPLPQQKSFHVETLNGKSYKCVTWRQYVMYPQVTGKLEIPSITFSGTVIQQNRNVDPFEAFLNGGSGYIEVERKLVAPGMSIQVDSLPRRPDGFSGGVGRLNLSAQADRETVRANEPVTIRVIVGGVGNLKLIKEPTVEFPKDFDKYDPKVTDKTRLTTAGIEGNMVYDFLAVPRNPGKYTIPAIELTYYDTGENQYRTLRTKEFEISVTKGSGSASTVGYQESPMQDIRGIKAGNSRAGGTGALFYGSRAYWVTLTALVAAFAALLVVFRKRAIDNADIVKLRGKRANRVATRRLRAASGLMARGSAGEFYDEVMRALWGYVGDKLNMPVAELSRENISGRLSGRGVDGETQSLFMLALDECEYNRYAPGDERGNMSQTYEAAMTAIVRIEDTLKGSGRRRTRRKATVALLALALAASPAWGVTKKNADDEYRKGNYQQAIADYEELLRKEPSAALHYNLGNAYYRTDNLPRAVLNYERALLLAPGDEDIRFNLDMARSKTIDKIAPRSEMFFITWSRALMNLASVDGWARIAVGSIALALVLALLYLFAGRMAVRKAGFYGAAALFALFILANVCAYGQRRSLTRRTGAIVTATSATLRKTPDAAAEQAAIIHEGTRVDIIDGGMEGWNQVRLADGREGWIEVSQMEGI